jgi:hypothetical protein
MENDDARGDEREREGGSAHGAVGGARGRGTGPSRAVERRRRRSGVRKSEREKRWKKIKRTVEGASSLGSTFRRRTSDDLRVGERKRERQI